MATTLTTGTSSGTQTTTSTPQSSVQPSDLAGQQTSSVQPGTATSLLNSAGGIPLGGSGVQPISLANNTQTQTVQAAAPSPAPARHINWGLAGISVAFFVVAVVLFWTTARAAKNTTKYS